MQCILHKKQKQLLQFYMKRVIIKAYNGQHIQYFLIYVAYFNVITFYIEREV